MNIEQIAQVCHEANASFCKVNGDDTQVSWENAPEWQKQSAIKNVEFVLNNPDAPASSNHVSWMQEKLDNGWAYGPTKDADLKTHPCLVDFEQLPIHQQQKDHLFKAIVLALS